MKRQLSGISGLFSAFLLIIIVSILLIAGCSKERADNGKVIATVNNDPVQLQFAVMFLIQLGR